jgi:hypothetical protein
MSNIKYSSFKGATLYNDLAAKHQCPHCPYTTFVNKDMVEHLMTHTNVPGLHELVVEKEQAADATKMAECLAKYVTDQGTVSYRPVSRFF